MAEGQVKVPAEKKADSTWVVGRKYEDDNIWEVVGGGDTGGVIVRISRERNSPQFPERLSSGSLVKGRELVGDRLLYDRIKGTGQGPDSGWVCVRQGQKDLLIIVDVVPPPGGWKVVSMELPTYVPPPPETKRPSAPEDGDGTQSSGKREGPDSATDSSAILPQTPQSKGQPFVFYHQIHFPDTKASGLRMAACLVAMDQCRTDLFSLCDQSVESFRKIVDPIIQLTIELKPGILKLSDDDGLLYTHPKSKGPILSWLRTEAEYGWPFFPLRNEEQNLFLVGKDRSRPKQAALANGRFQCAFADDSGETRQALSGDEWEAEFNRFFGKVKSDHSSSKLNDRQFSKLYTPAGRPFMPDELKKVSWRMSYVYGDLWKVLYHARVPELLWDVNMLAGGAFAELVKTEPDPQAMAVNLPKGMTVGEVYDVYCFLEQDRKKAFYVLTPEGGKLPSECVLSVVAIYDWSQGLPQDGKTLHSEDLELVGPSGRAHMINFVIKGEAKTTKYLDLEKLRRS